MVHGIDMVVDDDRAAGNIIDRGNRGQAALPRQRVIPDRIAVLQAQRSQFAGRVRRNDGFTVDGGTRRGDEPGRFGDPLVVPDDFAIVLVDGVELVVVCRDKHIAVHRRWCRMEGRQRGCAPDLGTIGGIERGEEAPAGVNEQPAIVIGQAAAEADTVAAIVGPHPLCPDFGTGFRIERIDPVGRIQDVDPPIRIDRP